jgi:hypothetical protein
MEMRDCKGSRFDMPLYLTRLWLKFVSCWFAELCSERVSTSSSEVAYEGKHKSDSDHKLNV